MKHLIFFLVLSFPSLGFGQGQPLSRSDKSVVEKNLENYTQQLQLGRIREASDHLNQVALLYWNHNQYDSAIKYYEQSVGLNTQIANENGIAMLHNNLGMLYTDVGKYEKALKSFEITLAARRAYKESVGMISSLINKSVVLNNLKRHDEAVEALQEALELARQSNDPVQMRSVYGMLSETYEKQGDAKSSIYYFDLYRTFHSKIQKEEIAEIQVKVREEELKRKLVEAQRKNQELELLAKQAELQKTAQQLQSTDSLNRTLYSNLSRAELSNELLQKSDSVKALKLTEANLKSEAQEREKGLQRRIFVVVALFLIIILGIIAYSLWKSKKFTRKLVEQKNQIAQQKEALSKSSEKIHASINYASRIQSAILPHKAEVKQLFEDSFLMYKPKDVVSGDFFWFAELNGLKIVAAVDCTGHGVPGAFMSIIGSILLNRIVLDRGILEPGKILDELRIDVRTALKQNEKGTTSRDGMDVALCVYNEQEKNLSFSGANNPLMLQKNGKIELIKGDKMPIGGRPTERETSFTTHTVEISPGDCFYIYSDGFQDQFGGLENGSSGRKFTRKRMARLFEENHSTPMNEAGLILQTAFQNWVQPSENQEFSQIDDVLVFGARI